MYNYRHSAYFVKTVIQAREWENYSNNLAIFAGACQSYYEALIQAGANFASSPARILIDFVDPLIVAENIAITDRNKFVSIKDFEKELRDGQRGISGIGVFGKKISTWSKTHKIKCPWQTIYIFGYEHFILLISTNTSSIIFRYI